ncbi:MAG TPA: cell envelope integrity protein TolA [Burkholderiaceae bacterium]|nr:cell envelope integrity protein TolA [Burkholderiaceae bacterium]
MLDRELVREPRRWLPLVLAVGMHVLLIGLLAFGVAWKSSEPIAVEAELWSSLPQVAAPAPQPAPPPPPKVDTPPPPPPPKPTPRVQAQPEPQRELPKPDIALEREREAQRKRDEQKRLDEQRKAEQRKAEERKQAEERKKAELQKAQDAEREKLAKAKAEADRKRKLAEDAAAKKAEQEAADKRFRENLARLSAQASGAPSTGNAAATSGPKGDPSYAGKVQMLIKSNTTYADPSASLPRAEFAVQLDPAGYVLNLRKTKSSGNAGWDEAVERAIRKSEPYPPDKSGRPPSSLTITHCPTC